MIDWDALVHGPVMGVFGEAASVQYTPVAGPTITVDGIFDEGAKGLQIVSDPMVNEVVPTLGVRLAQFPSDYDPRNSKGDTFVVRGVSYLVKDGKPDSHGWAILEATRA